MKRNLKVTIAALAAMLLMAFAVTVIISSRANDGPDDGILVGAAGGSGLNLGSNTNIDNIIDNSNSTDPDTDTVYHIVEITSGGASPLKDYVTGNAFETLVLNGHASDASKLMAAGKVEYTCYEAKNVSNDSTDDLVKISNADLIYLHIGSAAYSKTNDICEELYNILHTYAVGDYKPLIIDSPNGKSTPGGSSGSGGSEKTMGTLASDVFLPAAKSYSTFPWDQTKLPTAEEFLQHKVGSLYLGIRGDKTKTKWTELVDSSTTKKTMSKILVVGPKATPGDSSMAGKLLGNLTAVTDTFTRFDDGSAFDITGLDVYALSGTFATYGYNGKYVVPDMVQLDNVAFADLQSDANAVNFDDYDMIIIDSSCTGNISDDLYKKFAAAMYGGINMVYDKKMASSTGGTTPVKPADVPDFQENNFLELYYMVATTYDEARYDNILIMDPTKFAIITSGNSIASATPIADLINYSAYRGIGGKGNSSNMYTVLEIEPCYPIDTKYAEKNGNYYTLPSNVLNDVEKKDVLDENGEATVEYYDWEVSKSKIAQALGISENQINIVHKSTEELAAAKEPVLGTYDLVYIGGNKSALKEANEYRSIYAIMNWGPDAMNNLSIDKIRYLPIYTMYSHNGDLVNTDVSFTGESGGAIKSWPYVSAARVGDNEAFSTLNGNDISSNRLEELSKYVEAGMPIIVSSDVSNAYDAVINNPNKNEYLQNSIDPDSNMRKLLDVIYAKKTSGAASVLFGFDKSEDSEYQWVNGIDVNSTVVGATKRPKLTVTSMPTLYNMNDPKSRMDKGELNFQFRVDQSTAYTASLWVDDDNDGIFEKEMNSTVSNSSLKCSLPDSFFGPVYWKLQVKDNKTDMTSYTTGMSYVKNKTGAKQTVRVLQILPVEKVGYSQSDGAQGYNSLYFCPMCQNAYKRLTYNAESDTSSEYALRYSGNYNEYPENNGVGKHTKFSLGKHEHSFGIVKYDSNLAISDGTNSFIGCDDWSTNLADDISDLYDFDLDIMLRDEAEEVSRKVALEYSDGVSAAVMQNEIDSYDIDDTDADWDEWNAITSNELKYKFIIKKKHEEEAGKQYQLYLEQKAKTEALEEPLIKLIRKYESSNPSRTKDFESIIKYKRYSDIYSIYDESNYPADYKAPFFEYRDAKDKEIELHNKYKEEDRLSHYDIYKSADVIDNWLTGCYDTVIIGPSEDFCGDDISDADLLADLQEFIENDGMIMLFHDTLTRVSNQGTVNLTNALKPYFGMDRNRDMSLVSDANAYCKYSSTDKYFMTNLSYKPITDDSRYASWESDITSGTGQYFSANGLKLTNVAFTDAMYVCSDSKNPLCSPYRYASMSWSLSAHWGNGSRSATGEKGKYGTDKASQNNEGIVTKFPFTLSDQLNISGTHPQSYALDLENSKMTVWYSLAGGNNKPLGTNDDQKGAAVGTKAKKSPNSQSSMFAASPNDGGDSYFIYTYGNVCYCGAGHMKVTGVGRDNNDERRLYINMIVNSVRNSVSQPAIYVYDYGKDSYGEFIKKDSNGDYYCKVDTDSMYPEFSFKVDVDKSDGKTKLARVRAYYDLDFTELNQINNYSEDQYHKLILDWDNSIVTDGVRYDVNRYGATLKQLTDENGHQIKEVAEDGTEHASTMLKLKPEYFEPYNGKYTYLVIEATDTKGNIVYQRIKINLKDYLFDLT